MASGPPDHPGYLLVPVPRDSSQATKPLALYEGQGYRLVPGMEAILADDVLFVWMEQGYRD